MRRASNERAIRTQGKGDPQLPPARKGRGGICGPNQPETTASGFSRDHNPTHKRLAEAETPTPLEAQNHSQLLVLASIDLRSQHGRLVSARVIASLRKGVLGSCNRAASQAARAPGGKIDFLGRQFRSKRTKPIDYYVSRHAQSTFDHTLTRE